MHRIKQIFALTIRMELVPKLIDLLVIRITDIHIQVEQAGKIDKDISTVPNKYC